MEANHSPYLNYHFSPSIPSPPLPSQRRQELEKDRRKLQQDISDLQEQLAKALQRIEDLEAIQARLEKELAAMTQK